MHEMENGPTVKCEWQCFRSGKAFTQYDQKLHYPRCVIAKCDLEKHGMFYVNMYLGYNQADSEQLLLIPRSAHLQ